MHWKEFAVLLTTHGVPIQHSVGGTMLTQGVGLQNSRGCSAAGGLCYVASPPLLISPPPSLLQNFGSVDIHTYA